MDEPKFEYRIITGDTAYKTKTSNDYSVFQCWGYNKELKSAFLIDQIRGKWEIPNLREILLRFYLKHVKIKNGKLRCCYIEEKASGAYLIQDLKKKHGIPIKRAEKTNTSNVDKVTRAHNEVDNVSCGYVYLPGRNLKDLKYGWVSEFISEFSSFTSNGTHTYDDQIDAALYALNILLRHKAAVKVTRNRVFSF